MNLLPQSSIPKKLTKVKFWTIFHITPTERLLWYEINEARIGSDEPDWSGLLAENLAHTQEVQNEEEGGESSWQVPAHQSLGLKPLL